MADLKAIYMRNHWCDINIIMKFFFEMNQSTIKILVNFTYHMYTNATISE